MVCSALFGEIGRRPLLEIELYDPIPEPVDPLNAQSTINPPVERVEIRLVHVNKPLQSLLYSVNMAYEAMVLLPEKDLKRLKIMNVLSETMDETTRFLDTLIADEAWFRSLEERLTERMQALTANQRAAGFTHMGRTITYRCGMAVAGTRDGAQGEPNIFHDDGADGGVPGFCLFPESAALVCIC